MTERNWKSGPPPHIGWWNASMCRNTFVWRWWDGTGWRTSNIDPKLRKYDGVIAERVGEMEWSDYWPENARVPRVDPSDPKNNWIVAYINASVGDTPHQQFWAGRAWAAYDTRQFWAGRAWAAYDTRQIRADAAAAGSTPTVQAMKARMKPTQEAPAPAYVPGSNQRLSHAVRAADVDFSGAMRRNQDPEARRRDCRASDLMGGPHDCSMVALRSKGTPGSNGQAQAEVKDPLREYSSVELLQEVIRRLR